MNNMLFEAKNSSDWLVKERQMADVRASQDDLYSFKVFEERLNLLASLRDVIIDDPDLLSVLLDIVKKIVML